MDRVELNPRDAMRLGQELFKADRHADAFEAFRAVAETEPENWEAAYQAAFSLSAMKRYAEAEAWYDRAMAIVVTQANLVALNKSVALGEQGKTEEGIRLLDGLIARQPGHAHAHYNRGVLRMQRDDFEGGLVDFERSLALDPDTANGDARFCRGFANLVLGDYERGFRDFEHRLKDNVKGGPAQGEELRPEHVVPREYKIAPDVSGRTILVLSEMGRGDMIQFGRYLPMLVELGARVLVVADRGIEALFRGMDGVTVFAPTDVLPAADYWCHMMGLAHVFGTSVDTVPPPMPLTYDPELLETWRRYYISDDTFKGKKHFNVGLCWAGSPISRYDEHRSIPLAMLQPILDLMLHYPIRFFDLQTEIRESDMDARESFRFMRSMGAPKQPGVPYFSDFRQTAHAMKCLDLVITVDTSVAHMAGTVGVPTWVLLTRFRTYWLWIKGMTTTPWYPSFELFRQKVHGDWPAVIETVRDKLARTLDAR